MTDWSHLIDLGITKTNNRVVNNTPPNPTFEYNPNSSQPWIAQRLGLPDVGAWIRGDKPPLPNTGGNGQIAGAPTSPAPVSAMNTAPLSSSGFSPATLPNVNTVKAKPVSIAQALQGGAPAGSAPAGASVRAMREAAGILPAPKVLTPRDIAIQKYMDSVEQEGNLSYGQAKTAHDQLMALQQYRQNLGAMLGAPAFQGYLVDQARNAYRDEN